MRIFPLGTRGRKGPLAVLASAYSAYIPLVVILGLLASLFESIGIGLLIPLLTLLLADTLPPGIPRPILQLADLTGGFAPSLRLTAMAAMLLALILLKVAVQAANSMIIAWINGALGRDVRSALAKRVLHYDYAAFQAQDHARLVQIISTDSWFLTDAIRYTLVMIPAAVGLVVFTVVLAWLDWRLFLLAMIGTVVIRAMPFLLERRLAVLSVEVAESNYVLGERMAGIVSDLRTIRVFSQEEREQARFDASAERVRRAMFASRRLSSWISPGVDALSSALFVALLAASYRLGVSLPALTAFVVLLSRGQPYARTISENRLEIAAVQGSLREVEWLLQPRPGQTAAVGATLTAIDQPIRFADVSFRYADGSLAVREANFTIEPGKSTALLGRSGAGKTTLVNLLCRLVEPERGAIFLGDRPVASLDAEQWRARIALAGQDVELVEGTLAFNIAYARPDATEADIREAAATAGVDRFVGQLAEGYETIVGQQGLRLSGGQRQRVGIARALLRRPDLLILDEAFSAVDAMSEAEIIKLLSEHRHFRAALIISHRRSTLAACENGIVLDQGRVIDSGPLDKLAYFHELA